MEINKVSKALSNVVKMLDVTENNSVDIDDWLVIAWVCRVAIMDIVEKGNWPMSYEIFVLIKRRHIRMTIHEAYMMSIGRLAVKTNDLGEEEREAINDVLERKGLFDEMNRNISKFWDSSGTPLP